jgi:hypothetical protein
MATGIDLYVSFPVRTPKSNQIPPDYSTADQGTVNFEALILSMKRFNRARPIRPD